MSQSQRILVVDDEVQIARVLRRSLAARGYEVQVAGCGEEALEIFNAWAPDLVITDLSMPNMGGLELCRRIRATSQAPIIVLSVKGEERAKVEALDAGADDYVTKPFGIDELLARVRATLRRAPATADQQVKVLQVGDFLADLESHSVKARGVEVHLTPKEYELLVYLIRHPNKVLTHRALLGAVWGGDYVEQTEYLRVFIGQLRKKIEADPAKPRYILTEPWIGYRFNPGGQFLHGDSRKTQGGILMSLKNLLFGAPLATHEEGEQRVGPLAGIPMLGLDALASAAYGPEAAMTLLIPLGALGVGYVGPISIIIIALLFIVYLSYRQTIGAYPTGGGSYTVARRNLGVFPGLLAAAALLLDYVLVVAVGISAGVGALVSAV